MPASSNGEIPSLLPQITDQIVVYLPHLGLSTLNTDFPEHFNDVKFVCTGGSSTRMAEYAKLFSALANVPLSGNLCNRTDRFVMYKTGPVLWVNHGIGMPSASILLCELFKLLRLACCAEVQFIRLGTCGGVDVKPGTVVISSGVVNVALEKHKFVQWIQGKQVKRDALLDSQLGDDLFGTAAEMQLPVDRGLTFGTDDFYEGQMRLDGPFCDYGEEDKLAFMRQLIQIGVKNIEMESTCFAALTHRAQFSAAICCVVLVNRMEKDTMGLKECHGEFEKRPFQIVSRHIMKKLNSQMNRTI
uniref:Putative effector protein n=1 Tax=Heterodera avenae TaxID=34510 RepID=A0A2L0VDF2_HETAV|nr:putative effector protein [Heterodera avenae]